MAMDFATAAEPIGTAKARGDYSSKFWGSSGGRSVRHAREYSGGYREYARQTPTIAPPLAQQEAAGVVHNITAAQKQYAEMKKTTSDPQAVKSIDAIQKHLTAAATAHGKLHELCHKDAVDGDSSMKCCDDIDAQLDKALAEHDKLMKHLGVEAAAAPAAK
jgi:hypothetical protein